MTNSDSPDDDLFYFETDHLALRGNKDYSEVVKTLFILCAQREKALKDYNKTLQIKKEALENPAMVLEKLYKGESLGLPDTHRLPELPTIDWSRYDVKLPEEALKAIYKDEENKTKKKTEVSEPKKSKSNYEKWTPEEQKRLEELLQIYPPEPIELRRYKKIAQALGNRTLQQVSSRIQKYFLKLYKAGLPIPGRIPKSAEKYKKSYPHKHQRHNHYLWKPTTFFPELFVPVTMNEAESAPGPSTNNVQDESSGPSTSQNYLMHTNYYEGNQEMSQKSDVELQLDLLKRIRQEKVRESSENQRQFHHLGFKCDYCNEEPIKGSRWHCITCRTKSMDYCTDCVLAQMYSDNCHPLNHHFIIYNDKETFSDSGSVQSNNEGNEDSESDSEQEDEEFEELNDEENGLDENNDMSWTNNAENMEDTLTEIVDEENETVDLEDNLDITFNEALNNDIIILDNENVLNTNL